MAPLQAWANASPAYQITTRSRSSCRNPNNSQPTFVLSKATEKENVKYFSPPAMATPSLSLPKKAQDIAAHDKGEPLSLLKGRSMNIPPARTGTICLSPAAQKPRGGRGRFSRTKRSSHAGITIYADNDEHSYSPLGCQRLTRGDGKAESASVIGNPSRELVHKTVRTQTDVVGRESDTFQDASTPEMVYDDSSDSDTAADEDPLDKIDRLEKFNEELIYSHRAISIIAEVAMKGFLLWSSSDGDIYPLSPVFNDPSNKTPNSTIESSTLVDISNLFDTYGHLSPDLTTFASSRADHIRTIASGVLVRKRNDLILSLDGYDLPTFLLLAASFLPQIQFLSENGMGDTLAEQKCGIDVAWSVLFDILSLAVKPLPVVIFGFPSAMTARWTGEAIEALESIDALLVKTLNKKVQVMETTKLQDKIGKLLEFSQEEIEWLGEAERTLEHLASEMARTGDGLGDEGWFFPNTRDALASLLDQVRVEA